MSRPWLIRSLFTLPLLLCLAGWAWSARDFAYITYRNDVGLLGCASSSGVVAVALGWDSMMPAGWHCEVSPQDHPHAWPKYDPNFDFSFLGFGLAHNMAMATHGYLLCAPYWFLLLVFSALLLLVWRKTRPAKPGGAFPVETGD
jgi:hypothetical protein